MGAGPAGDARAAAIECLSAAGAATLAMCLQAALEECLAPLALLYLLHPHAPAAAAAHQLCCALLVAAPEELREPLAAYYVRRCLEGLPGAVQLPQFGQVRGRECSCLPMRRAFVPTRMPSEPPATHTAPTMHVCQAGPGHRAAGAAARQPGGGAVRAAGARHVRRAVSQVRQTGCTCAAAELPMPPGCSPHRCPLLPKPALCLQEGPCCRRRCSPGSPAAAAHRLLSAGCSHGCL